MATFTPMSRYEDAGDLDRLRRLSDADRWRMIVAACRSAALLEESRRLSGLPPSEPAPWPDSTLAFLREHAAHVRR